jgi:hypothetical protein
MAGLCLHDANGSRENAELDDSDGRDEGRDTARISNRGAIPALIKR